MRPAFSVIFLTTLIGAGQGLLLALYSWQLYSALNPGGAGGSAGFYALGSLLALALLVAGLVSSFFHLGRPERAWRAAACWRTSWLSREVIVLPLLMAAVAAWGLAHFAGPNPVLATLANGVALDLSLLLGALAALLCLALFVCTGMIYACIKMLQEWASPLTVVNYTLLGSASGFTLATAFASWQEPALTAFYAGGSLGLTALAFLGRGASLLRNAGLKHKSDMASAIGIHGARIEQQAQGAMGGSYNTREFFHGATRRKYRAVKWLFLVMVFPLPMLLVSIGAAAQSGAALALAFLLQYAGLLLERWFFFAQANHPQNLYYQTV